MTHAFRRVPPIRYAAPQGFNDIAAWLRAPLCRSVVAGVVLEFRVGRGLVDKFYRPNCNHFISLSK
jgi:hypothetical protein